MVTRIEIWKHSCGVNYMSVTRVHVSPKARFINPCGIINLDTMTFHRVFGGRGRKIKTIPVVNEVAAKNHVEWVEKTWRDESLEKAKIVGLA